MPLVTFANDPIGPTLEIGISPVSSAAVIVAPPPSTVWIKAIADTGATATCICRSSAVQAGLFLAGKGLVSSANQTAAVDLYFGDLWIKGTVPGGSPFIWPFRGRTFLELALPSNNHEALLGMDILGMGVLVVNGPAKSTTFAW